MPRMPGGSGAARDSIDNSSSYSSSVSSSTSVCPSSCASISPPRSSFISTPSSRPRRHPSTSNEYDSARDHLASLIKKHGPPTPVSSTSSLRRLTSTSPINASFLPPTSVDTPPASPVTAAESSYVSTAGSQPIPIPIPRNPNRSLEDLPLTPLTGRFDHGLYLSERPSKNLQVARPHQSRDDKPTRKKKTRSAEPSVSSSSTSTSTARSHRSKRMPHSDGPSLTMSPQPGQAASKQPPKDARLHLGNLPRFHPAAYQSPNSASNSPLSPTTDEPRSFAYRVSSGGSRDALRQYRELVAASVSLSRNSSSESTEISAPRLDPLGSPGPVTPLALEDSDSYMASRSVGLDDKSSQRRLESAAERDRVTALKDSKAR